MLPTTIVKRKLSFFIIIIFFFPDCIATECLKVEILEAAAFLFLSFAQQKRPKILLLLSLVGALFFSILFC